MRDKMRRQREIERAKVMEMREEEQVPPTVPKDRVGIMSPSQQKQPELITFKQHRDVL